MVKDKGWGNEEDLWQEAMEGIIKNWRLIESDDLTYVNFKNHFVKEYILPDSKRTERLFAEATRSAISYDKLIDNITTIAFLKKGARVNLNRYIRENLGNGGTKKREGENKHLVLSDATLVHGEEIDEDKINVADVFDSSEDYRYIGNIAYHNADTESVLKSVCKIFEMDRMNFDVEDVPHLQELFLSSIAEVLGRDRGYSGLGPDGKERYRETNPVTVKNEQWVIEKVLVERVGNLKMEFLKDFLKNKPDDWEYEFPGRKVEGGVKEYDEVRRECLDILNKHFPEMENEFFDEAGDLRLTDRHIAFTEIFEKNPDLYRLYERRKVAFKRLRRILGGRADEVLLTYEAKIIDYLIGQKGQKRVY